ncbi:MAG TPA: hypothetical protein VL984_09255 [Acidimicrobiales bacterium]|nr:hypothetical protein [Acidimicrobiales bacterium]
MASGGVEPRLAMVGRALGTLSVLLPPGSPAGAGHPETRGQPEYFADLNLDQFVVAVTAGREEYELAPFFYEHLEDAGTIAYRQEVFRDLEDSEVTQTVATFAQSMRQARERLGLANKLRYRYQAESWFVDAVGLYCDAVVSLARGLGGLELRSQAMRAMHAHVERYTSGEAFSSLVSAQRGVHEALAKVCYCVNIKGGRVTATRYEGETDYGAEVLATFERFKQGAVKDYRARFPERAEMDHVEAGVLGLVARLYPEEFALLDEFCSAHKDFVDPTVRRFDREVQFYMGYLDHVAPLRAAGLNLCYPELTQGSKEVFAQEAFDLVLASKLVKGGAKVVCNDFSLAGPERVLVVSGPNQGGKTTFARMFGQLHHLGSIGCPVPGTRAQLHLFDQLYTHFEREENLVNATGKLEDDLLRARRILSRATTDSVLVLNEPFSSTTLHDSLFLGTKAMERLVELDVLAVFVTFVEELASFGPSTVSMVSTVVPENPAERTYKVVRRRADGLAYALALAQKYRVTYRALRERLS